MEGFSKFGRYAPDNTTQVQDDDGPFVYCGFEPAAIWIKGIGAAESWVMRDGTRNPTNPVNLNFSTNQPGAQTTSQFDLDFCANGFKIRNGDGVMNFNNSGPYIYAAWAYHPFAGNNVQPGTAR